MEYSVNFVVYLSRNFCKFERYVMDRIETSNIEKKRRMQNIIFVIVGNIMAAGSVNLIITPMHLYNGGFTGLAQLIRMFFLEVLHLPQIPGIDYLGLIYYTINIPLFILAYKALGKRYTVTSMLSIGTLAAAMALIPVAKQPLFDDYLTACVVGGLISGIGAGLVMRGGTSGGGQDIVGTALSKINPNAKVGIIGIIINCVIYAICFFVYDIKIVVYSFIYSTIISLAIDRVFIQNINVQALIFTKKEGISDLVMTTMGRGVTRWEGEGAYTEELTNILCVMISKYEIEVLMNLVHSVDENAFVIMNENTKVYGNFTKKLTSEANRLNIKKEKNLEDYSSQR